MNKPKRRRKRERIDRPAVLSALAPPSARRPVTQCACWPPERKERGDVLPTSGASVEKLFFVPVVQPPRVLRRQQVAPPSPRRARKDAHRAVVEINLSNTKKDHCCEYTWPKHTASREGSAGVRGGSATEPTAAEWFPCESNVSAGKKTNQKKSKDTWSHASAV